MMDPKNNSQSKLLVVVPDVIMDEVSFARRARIWPNRKIWIFSFSEKLNSTDTEPRLRRRLVTLSAIAGCGKSRSNYITHTFSTWLDVVSREFNPGDIILCPSRLSSSSTDLYEEEQLYNQFNTNLIFSSGIVKSKEPVHLKQITEPIVYWVGIFLILGVSFMIESAFEMQIFSWIRIASQAVMLSLEVMLLYAWHRFMLRKIK